MLRKWQKFQQLSWAETFLLTQALLLLPVNILGLKTPRISPLASGIATIVEKSANRCRCNRCTRHCSCSQYRSRSWDFSRRLLTAFNDSVVDAKPTRLSPANSASEFARKKIFSPPTRGWNVRELFSMIVQK